MCNSSRSSERLIVKRFYDVTFEKLIKKVLRFYSILNILREKQRSAFRAIKVNETRENTPL